VTAPAATQMNRAQFDWIERARSVDIGEIITQRGIRLHGRGHTFFGPCPMCGGRDRFSIHTGKQVFNCRGCGGRGGGSIDLVRFLDGVDFVTAVSTITGEPRPNGRAVHRQQDPDRERRQQQERERHERLARQRERQAQADDAARLRRAEAIWREAVPIAGTSGEDYLAMRGIDVDDVPDHAGLRFHPQCPWDQGKQPCMVARFTHAVTGAPLGIHRRAIGIPGAKPRSYGPIAGGVIRLWPDDCVTTGVVIGEGIETTLAAATRIEHRNTLLQPAWACGSAGALEAFPVLAGIEALTILVDNDESGAGQRAADRCAERWAGAGREVTLLTPRDIGLDFNDLVRWTS
jgi:phage/plasmid primase-like uncharacterized protein